MNLTFPSHLRSLGIKTTERSLENYGLKNPPEIAIKKFKQHASVNLINKNITNNETFHFSPTEHKTILNKY